MLRRFFIETRGCQMNVSDSEIVRSVLLGAGFEEAPSAAQAGVVLLNTCAIREKAESKIWGRLRELRDKRVGVLGCMAERVKGELLDHGAFLVAGPDAYRDLPRLLETGGVNTKLGHETYADVAPVRTGPSAFVSIQRGCDNMCTYCIVPFTRGRERSRPAASVVDECARLEAAGVREITLLGQNVNSYADYSIQDTPRAFSSGFEPLIRRRRDEREACRFADLLKLVAEAAPSARIRFTSPHPKDFPDELLEAVAATPNVANQLHLPAQSGSDAVLARMRRGYTKDVYLNLVERAKMIIPDVALSSDFIAGFCGETREDHEHTLDLLRTVPYDTAFLYAFSLRPKTHADYNLQDDVPPDVKKARLADLNAAYDAARRQRAQDVVGETQVVLVDGHAHKQPTSGMFPEEEGGGRFLKGRNDAFRRVVLPDGNGNVAVGDFVRVRVHATNGTTLFATPLAKCDVAGRLI